MHVVVLSLALDRRVCPFPNDSSIPTDGCVLITPDEFDLEPLFEVRRSLGRANLPQPLEDALVAAADEYLFKHSKKFEFYFPGQQNLSLVFTNAPQTALQDRLTQLGVDWVPAESILTAPDRASSPTSPANDDTDFD